MVGFGFLPQNFGFGPWCEPTNGICCSVNVNGWSFYLEVVGIPQNYMLYSNLFERFAHTGGWDPQT